MEYSSISAGKTTNKSVHNLRSKLLESTFHQVYLKYTSIILQVCIKNTDLVSQNVLQMYFLCRNKADLKYTSSSVIQQDEGYLKYT